jgi:hypothetical protein
LGQRPAIGMTDGKSTWWNPSLRTVRNASAVVTVLAVAALGVFATRDAHAVTTHTVTKHTTVVTRVDAPSAQTQEAAVPQAASPPADSLFVASPLTTRSTAPAIDTVGPIVAPVPETTPTVAVPTGTNPTPATGSGGSGASTPEPPAIPTCPLPLTAPAEPGGLASIVGLAPLFGPFSSEAFAAAPAFQPMLQDIGPFLVAFADAYATEQPSVAPFVTQVESLENAGFSLVSPYYGPYRSKFLAAEAALATALAPEVKTLAANAATSCVIDIEGMLTEAAPSS